MLPLQQQATIMLLVIITLQLIMLVPRLHLLLTQPQLTLLLPIMLTMLQLLSIK
jgi:hypothetical protein